MSWQPQDRTQLIQGVNGWCNGTITPTTNTTSGANTVNNGDPVGDINTWDTSQITDMSQLFNYKTTFNDDISSWDVSSVTNMWRMFYNASSFNGDVSSWDVSSVTNMNSMFYNASSFNGDMSSWDVSSVTNMTSMFRDAASFNGNISSWDVSSVTNMSYMFYMVSPFNGNISSWDVSSVTNMNSMFSEASSFNGDMSSWDVSSVTNMASMFRDAASFNGNISSWDVSSVTNMNSMFNRFFSSSTSFNRDISSWDVSSVESMTNMFRGASDFNIDISRWDVSRVTSMNYIFTGASAFKIANPSINDNGDDYFVGPTLFTSSPVTTATEDSMYTYTVASSDTGATFELLAPLQSWLSLNGATLSGTPLNSDVTTSLAVTIRLTSSDGTTTEDQVFTISVASVNDLPVITSTAVTEAVEGSLYSYTVTATDEEDGANVTLTANNLPSWLSLNGAILSGTPSASNVESYSVEIVATDSNNDVTNHEFTITVHALPTVSISATNSAGNVANNGYTNSGPIILTFVTSEATTEFTDGDVIVTGGSLNDSNDASTFAATSTTEYTATFTPAGTDPFVQACTIDVNQGAFPGTHGASKAASFSFTYDTASPTMTISAEEVASGDKSIHDSLSLTFTSSEATTDFSADDIFVVQPTLIFPLKLKLTQASSNNYWNVTSVNVEVNGVNQVHTINELGSTEIVLQEAFVGTNNKIKISNHSPVLGYSAAQYNNTWDLFEIELFDNNDIKLSLSNLTHDTTKAQASYPLSNLIDNNYSTFWAYNPLVVDIDGNPDSNVDGIQWVEIEFNSLISSFTNSGDDKVYTATFTPSGPGDYSIAVNPSVFKDMANNLNLAALPNPFNWTYLGQIFTPTTKVELETAIAKHLSGNDSHYGTPDTWDTSLITDMSDLFKDTAFNYDISGWDVSNVTNFTHMFAGVTPAYSNVSVNNIYPGTYWTHANVKSVTGLISFNLVLCKTPPVITFTNSTIVTIDLYAISEYTDAGASAVNYMGSNISSNIVVSGDVVNPSVAGTYTITYNVTDPLSGLSAAQVTRTVNIVPPALETSVDANNTMTIKIGYGNYTNSLTTVLADNNYNASVHNLVIEGYGENLSTWVDFKFHYGSNGKPTTLHIQNITLSTATIDGYAVYSRNTLTTMSNVTITGYSGDTTAISTVSDWDNSGTAPSNVGRWAEKQGGAMRIRAADYTASAHTSASPTLSNVTVTNCCRGIRIQDTTGAYVMNCSVSNVSDNGIYFASGSYDSTSGCNYCTIDTCSTTNIGQCGLHNIGGSNNIFKNCTVNNTRGAGASIYNTNGSIIVYNCTFENANTAETRTPWGGGTDSHNGAAFGMVVATTDTNALVTAASCTFVSGADSVYYKSSPGKLIAVGNTITAGGYPGGDIDAAADSSTITIAELSLVLSESNPPVITLDGNEIELTELDYISEYVTTTEEEAGATAAYETRLANDAATRAAAAAAAAAADAAATTAATEAAANASAALTAANELLNYNKNANIQSAVDELNTLLTELYPTFMSEHDLVLVANSETVQNDLLQIPVVGQSIVDQVFANNSAAFLHLTEDTENNGWNTVKYDDIVTRAGNGGQKAVRALELIQYLNPLAADIDARDDSSLNRFNYSNAAEGIFNGINEDLGVHHLGFFKNNELMNLLQNRGYGIMKWYGLSVYGYSDLYSFTDDNDVTWTVAYNTDTTYIRLTKTENDVSETVMDNGTMLDLYKATIENFTTQSINEGYHHEMGLAFKTYVDDGKITDEYNLVTYSNTWYNIVLYTSNAAEDFSGDLGSSEETGTIKWWAQTRSPYISGNIATAFAENTDFSNEFKDEADGIEEAFTNGFSIDTTLVDEFIALRTVIDTFNTDNDDISDLNASVIADLETLTAAISSAETVLTNYVVDYGSYLGISNRLTSSIAGAKTIFDNYLSAYLQTLITNMTTSWSQVSDDGIAYGLLQSIITLIGDSHISTVDDDVTSTVVGDVDTLLQHLTDSVMPLDMSTTTYFREKLTEWKYICLNSTDGDGNIMVVNLENVITEADDDLTPIIELLDNMFVEDAEVDNNYESLQYDYSSLLYGSSIGINNDLLSEPLGYVAELFNKQSAYIVSNNVGAYYTIAPWIMFLQESSFIGCKSVYANESYSLSRKFIAGMEFYYLFYKRSTLGNDVTAALPHYLVLNNSIGLTGFEHTTEEDKSTILLDRLNALLLDIEEK